MTNPNTAPSAAQPYAIDGVVYAIARKDQREAYVMFDTPAQANGFVEYMRRFIEKPEVASRDAGGAASGGQGEPTAFSPCPFCQHKDVGFARGTPDHFGGWDIRSDSQFVKCESCGAEGPPADWDEEARRLWNSRSSIQRAPTPPTDKELLDLAEDCNFSVWNRELYLKVVRAALGWRPKTAALSAAPPSPHPDHTGSEAVAPEAKPTYPFTTITQRDAMQRALSAFASFEGRRCTINSALVHDATTALRAVLDPSPLPKNGIDTYWLDSEYLGTKALFVLAADHEKALAAAAPPAPPAPLPGKDERALFQAWARDRHWNLSLRADGERYMSESTQEGWYAWKGRAALSAQAAPADYPPPVSKEQLLQDLGYFSPSSARLRDAPEWQRHDRLRRFIEQSGRSGVSADPLPDPFTEGVNTAAAMLDKMADDYSDEHGRSDPDTGVVEFGRGAKEDYYNTLRELADEIRNIVHGNAATQPPSAKNVRDSALDEAANLVECEHAPDAAQGRRLQEIAQHIRDLKKRGLQQ